MNVYLTEQNTSACCGCGVCEFACPTRAITMKQDEEGFAFPSVNTDKCVQCGKCAVVCPMEHCAKNTDGCEAYAAHSHDAAILKASSSGGVFTELAKTVLADGGAVCGCTIDEEHQVKHIVIHTVAELPLLQGSKYVQSDMTACLPEVDTVLKSGKTLLFVGTPCQVSAIKNQFHSPHLMTIDLLCHGVPSQKLFDFYIAYLEQKHGGVLTEIAFRDKEKFGWSITQRYKIKRNGKEKTYYLERHTSEYFSGFLRNMTQRLSCYACPYTTPERTGDITLADFWGVDKVRPELLCLDGTSLVIANTERGKDLFLSIAETIAVSPVDFADATYQNINFLAPPEKHAMREDLYRLIFEDGFKKTGKRYILPKNYYKYKIAQALNINFTKKSLLRGKKS